LRQQAVAARKSLVAIIGGHKKHRLAEHEAKLRALVAAQPDLTITELWQKLTALDIKVGRSAVGRFLRHLQLTFKKNSARRRTRKS
jgi:transposase